MPQIILFFIPQDTIRMYVADSNRILNNLLVFSCIISIITFPVGLIFTIPAACFTMKVFYKTFIPTQSIPTVTFLQAKKASQQGNYDKMRRSRNASMLSMVLLLLESFLYCTQIFWYLQNYTSYCRIGFSAQPNPLLCELFLNLLYKYFC